MAREQFFHPAAESLFKKLEHLSQRSGVSRGVAFEDWRTAMACALAAETKEAEYLAIIERHKAGKTPVLTPDQAKLFLDSIETETIVGLRDRALIATMIYSHARVSAVLGMHIEDHYADGKHWWIRPNPILSMAMSVPTWVASSATPSCATAEGRRSPAMTR